ncbi:hypothetical protein IWZ01DRAFT_540659 [Phyllosticta capitalensis]
MVDGHEDELTPEQTEGFKVGEKKTIDEYQQLVAMQTAMAVRHPSPWLDSVSIYILTAFYRQPFAFTVIIRLKHHLKKDIIALIKHRTTPLTLSIILHFICCLGGSQPAVHDAIILETPSALQPVKFCQWSTETKISPSLSAPFR